MKKKLLAILLLLACLFLGGCTLMEDVESAAMDSVLALVAEKAEESGADVLARQFVDGVLANDAEMCLAAMAPAVTMESMQAALPQIREMLPDADSYTLTPMHFSVNADNGVTQTVCQFKMEMGGQFFLVQTLLVSGTERLYNINIAPASTDAWDVSETEEPFSIFTVLSILLTIASCAITLWALVHCARHKMKRKWLWVLLVLFGSVMLTLTLSGSRLSFRFNLGLYLVASQILPSSGGFALKLVVPVGPIIYLIRRKVLTTPPKTAFAEAFADTAAAEAPQAVEGEAAPLQEEPHESEEV